ncbi:hypothetical protein WMF26_24995 [Sorangium sp. So ce185]|uniref:hypothetical protein n=1 Tax=Sorangium sp. So ce185 TaxID=3133287 RepID=UPI003F61732F
MSDANFTDTEHGQPPPPSRAQASEAASEQPSPTNPSTSAGSAKNKIAWQVNELLELAAGAELFRSPDGVAFATLKINGHRETWRLESRGFSDWLKREFYRRHQSVPGAQTLRDALAMFEARARYEGAEEPVYLRVAEKNGVVYLDLGDKDWRAAEITPRGWSVVAEPPVKFRRTRGMQALPEPVRGGRIDDLRRFVNVDSDDAFHLLVAWLVGALRPTGPFAVLALQGEQGSAKSTTARLLRRLIDPSTAPTRRMPRDGRDLMIAAQNAWMLSFDNLSGLPVWLSDALCSLSTGGGFSTRALRTDDDEVIVSATRPLLLNGIAGITERPDLADRAVTVSLPAIPDDRRQDEATLRTAFDEAAPRILGALLDGVSAALRNIGTVTLPTKPRMADFALWVTAAEEGFSWAPGTFMAAYTRNRAETVEVTLETDMVAVAVRELFARRRGGIWEGSATALHAELHSLLPENVLRSGDWPKAPNTLTNRLRRIAPVLREAGVVYEDMARSGKAGSRGLRLRDAGAQMTVSTVSEPATMSEEAPQARASSVVAGEADGLLRSVAGREADDRLLAATAEMADSSGKTGRADDADGADDPSAGIVDAATEDTRLRDMRIHRDASNLPALAAAIRASEKVGLRVAATGHGMRRDQACSVAVALPSGEIHVVDLRVPHDVTPVIEALCEVLVVGHNLKPDLAHIANEFKLRPRMIFDTKVACELLDAGVHGEDASFFDLAHACGRILGAQLPSGRSQMEPIERLSDESASQLSAEVGPLLALEEAVGAQLRRDGLDRFAEFANELLLAELSIKFGDRTAGYTLRQEVSKVWAARLGTVQNEVCSRLGVDDADDDAEVLKKLHTLRVPVERVEIKELVPFLHIQEVGCLVRYRHLRDFAVCISGRGQASP